MTTDYRDQYGHTSRAAAFDRADVYGVAPDAARAAKRRLRLGIVGCGGVAQAKWLPAIRRLQTIGEPIDLAGVFDPDPARRDKVASLWGARACPDLDDLLRNVDLALVLAADAAHAPVTSAALAAGVACLVEKPLCRNLAEARALCDTAERHGVLLASVANKRFSPPYGLARQLIDSGALHGPPTVFSGKFTLGYPYVDLLEGGTIHLLDLVLWLMGPVEHLHARAIEKDGRIESAVVSLGFASGAIGTLTTSTAALSFKPWERVEMVGRHAVLTVEDGCELTLCDDETGPAKTWRPTVPNTLMFDESFGGYSGLLENVLDAVRGLAPLGATGRDGAAAVGLVEAIRRSVARGADIDLRREGFAV